MTPALDTMIRIAYENPELRPHLMPIIKQGMEKEAIFKGLKAILDKYGIPAMAASALFGVMAPAVGTATKDFNALDKALHNDPTLVDQAIKIKSTSDAEKFVDQIEGVKINEGHTHKYLKNQKADERAINTLDSDTAKTMIAIMAKEGVKFESGGEGLTDKEKLKEAVGQGKARVYLDRQFNFQGHKEWTGHLVVFRDTSDSSGASAWSVNGGSYEGIKDPAIAKKLIKR